MRWKKYSTETELTGITRKKAAECIADLLETECRYSFENDEYSIADSLNRQWRVVPTENVSAEKISNNKVTGANYLFRVKVISPFLYANEIDVLHRLCERLRTAGGLVNGTTKTSVRLDLSGLADREKYIINLKNMYLSRGKLFEKALGRELKALADLSELREKGAVGFQWFQSSFNAEDVTAYIQLA